MLEQQADDGHLNQYQQFYPVGGKHIGRNIVPILRKYLQSIGLDGLFIPHEDEWQNEYIPPAYDRLLYATGFSGSAGCAIIMADNAFIFIDGRYSEQVRQQTDGDIFKYRDLIANGPLCWLENEAPIGAKIGYNSGLISPDAMQNMQDAARSKNIELIELETDAIDAIWQNRPEFPMAKITLHNEEFSGETSASKRAKIAENLKINGIDYCVLTSPQSLAWLFNLRGGDVARSPLFLGRAIIKNDASATLFVNKNKITPEIIANLGNQVVVHNDDDFEGFLNNLNGFNVAIDNKVCSQKIFNILKSAGANIINSQDPCVLPRAMKNKTEISGAINAHIRDGVALAKFLKWFDENAISGELSEIDACKKLEYFRAQSPLLKDLSFDTISAAGANAAMAHYRVNEETNIKIPLNSLFLIDSGGQYFDGTTDVTRTICVGEINDEMKDRFTRVLKGHIALARIKFPPNTSGCMLDVLARAALWEVGLDYDHGTGHGVGAYLGVHEGPQRIAKSISNVPLCTGMIISNEPGFYKSGHYGIRTENLQYVSEAKIPQNGERPMHEFVTLTLAPIDKRALRLDILNQEEILWINNYHKNVLNNIAPYLEDDYRDWLIDACLPIGNL